MALAVVVGASGCCGSIQVLVAIVWRSVRVRGGGSARGEGGVVDEGVQGGGGVEEPGSWGANSLVSDDLGGTLAAAGRSGDRARSS